MLDPTSSYATRQGGAHTLATQLMERKPDASAAAQEWSDELQAASPVAQLLALGSDALERVDPLTLELALSCIANLSAIKGAMLALGGDTAVTLSELVLRSLHVATQRRLSSLRYYALATTFNVTESLDPAVMVAFETAGIAKVLGAMLKLQKRAAALGHEPMSEQAEKFARGVLKHMSLMHASPTAPSSGRGSIVRMSIVGGAPQPARNLQAAEAYAAALAAAPPRSQMIERAEELVGLLSARLEMRR